MLWDELHDRGWATLKATDACTHPRGNTNTTVHGAQVSQMFCYTRTRPSCLGDKPAPDHLLEYSAQFVRKAQRHDAPWAAFLQFTDSEEDSMALAGVLDQPVSSFLTQAMEFQSNTIIVITASHGM